MGADDRNEGHGPGECIEHEFLFVAATIAADGGYEEHECTRCGAQSIIKPGGLTAG